MSNTAGIIKILQSIQGNGTFVTSGTAEFVHPGLHIAGVGPIGIPWIPEQIQKTIALSNTSPFGKGSKTITDPSVRKSWEIEAYQMSFGNPEWDAFIQRLLKKVQDGLGVEATTIEANLYKLLIYEEGGFFLPHKDSEKEPGMFGTMTIGLPCDHTGGELVVRFDGREKTLGFSEAASNYKIPYAAFYADCEHEVQRVASGHRICLVYNLIQPKTSDKIQSPRFQKQVVELSQVLSTTDVADNGPFIILLGHQYTPANLSFNGLKHHDLPRAEAIAEAAEQAGCFAKLGLLTHYQMGDLEGDYDFEYSSRQNVETSGLMGEVYEDYLTVEHWLENGIPDLGKLKVLEKDIIKDIDFNEQDPIEEEEEHYTGNAGMTIQYWYHYAAMIIWSRKSLPNLLKNTVPKVRLNWLAYYLDHWQLGENLPAQNAKRIIMGFADPAFDVPEYNRLDFSTVATALVKIEDETLVRENCLLLLTRLFNFIKVEAWIALLKQYEISLFTPIIKHVTDNNNIRSLNHLLEIMEAIQRTNTPKLKIFALDILKRLPEILHHTDLHKKEKPFYYRQEDELTDEQILKSIIEKSLHLSQLMEDNEDWQNQLVQSIATPLNRKYVNEVLVPILLSQTYKGRTLNTALIKICHYDLLRRTVEKPEPPTDWSREVPATKSNRHLWEMLRPFMESKDQSVFEYRKNQSLRDELARAFDASKVDLKKETIRTGSPHTLRLTKTQASYERKLKKWTEDRKLLHALNALV